MLNPGIPMALTRGDHFGLRHFAGAIPILEKDGADALPMMLTAKFGQGYYDASANIKGLCYVFNWLELKDEVRGFYLRSEGEPDIDLYPAFCREPQVPDTAWMSTEGRVLHNEKERSMVPASYKGTDIIVSARVLERKEVLVGLILTDSRKTVPVRAYVQTAEKRSRSDPSTVDNPRSGELTTADFND